MVYLHGGTQTAAFIHIKRNQAFCPSLTRLVCSWYGRANPSQSPVKKRSFLLSTFKHSSLSHRRSGSWLPKTIPGILVNNSVHRPLWPSGTCLAGRSTLSSWPAFYLLVVTEINGLYYRKLLFFSYFDHEFS